MHHNPDRRPLGWLTADEAAAVAARHHLTLADAVALQVLADDAETAERLAALFATTKDAAA